MNKFAAFLCVLVSTSGLAGIAASASGKAGAAASAQADQPLNATERAERKRALRAVRKHRKQGPKAQATIADRRPGVPTRLNVYAVSTSSVSLDWTAPSAVTTAARYITYRDGANATSSAYSHATVSGLRCGSTYKLTVIAVSAAGRQSRAAGPVSSTTAKCATTAAPAPAQTPAPAPAPTPAPTPVPPATPSNDTFAQVLSADMTRTSEALPHGITYDFAYRPRLSAGVNPGGYTAFTGWGQLYECASGNPQPAARVEIRDIQSWIKSKATGNWRVVQQSTAMEGGAYSENFVNNTSKPADAYTLGSGSTSVAVGGGYNYHFWPRTARISIDPNDVAGVVTNVRYRLAPGTVDPAKPSPCYVLSMGADYWSALAAQWNQFLTNRDVGIGRFKRVDGDWRTGTMSAAPGTTAPTPSGSTAGEYR